MANNVEPMDIDDIESDFDNKENAYQNNVLPKISHTEKGYEELDVSDLNMKLRYSFTPASSPMSKSYTPAGNDLCNYDRGDGSLTGTIINDNANMTRSLDLNCIRNETLARPSKPLALNINSTASIDGNGNPIFENSDLDVTVDQNLVNKNVTLTLCGTHQSDGSESYPCSSSSSLCTPIPTSPITETVKPSGSPIMRGLKSVLSIFRQSQSPISVAEMDDTLQDKLCESNIVSPDNTEQPATINAMLSSTPISDLKKGGDINFSKSNSPHKDSIVFNEDLVNDLQWNDETILFSKEKIPIHKLFFQHAQSLSSPDSSSISCDKKIQEIQDQTMELLEPKNYDEPMDISLNHSVPKNITMAQVHLEEDMNSVKKSVHDHTCVDSIDSKEEIEFLDCENTFTVEGDHEPPQNLQQPLTSLVSQSDEELLKKNIPDELDVIELQNTTEANFADSQENKLIETDADSLNTVEERLDKIPELKKNEDDEWKKEDSNEHPNENIEDNNQSIDKEVITQHNISFEHNLFSVNYESQVQVADNTGQMPVISDECAVDDISSTIKDETILLSESCYLALENAMNSETRDKLQDLIDDNMTCSTDIAVNRDNQHEHAKFETLTISTINTDLLNHDLQMNLCVESENIGTAINMDAEELNTEAVDKNNGLDDNDKEQNRNFVNNICRSEESYKHLMIAPIENDKIESKTIEEEIMISKTSSPYVSVSAEQDVNEISEVLNSEIVEYSEVSPNLEGSSMTDNISITTSPQEENLAYSKTIIEDCLLKQNQVTESALATLISSATEVVINILNSSTQALESTNISFDELQKDDPIDTGTDSQNVFNLTIDKDVQFDNNTKYDDKWCADDFKNNISTSAEKENEIKETISNTEIHSDIIEDNIENVALFENDKQEVVVHEENTASVETTNCSSLDESICILAGSPGPRKIIKSDTFDVDDNIDPFKTKSKIRESPPPTIKKSSIGTQNKINSVTFDFDDDMNPFATKSKIRQTPPPHLDVENSCNISDNLQCSLKESTIEPNNDIIEGNSLNTELASSTLIEKVTQDFPNGSETFNTDNIHSSIDEEQCDFNIESSDGSKDSDTKDITVKEILTEDEDTIEGPFLENSNNLSKLSDSNDFIQSEAQNQISEFGSEKIDLTQFNNVDILCEENEENFEPGEVFIDANAFDFFMNQNGNNDIHERGKESLFLKFDPLCANKHNASGVAAALSNLQKRFSTPQKPKRNGQTDIFESPSPSFANSTIVQSSPISCHDDPNVTVSRKPVMAVTPAINSDQLMVTPNRTTPVRPPRQSVLTSPAIAVIDRLISMSANNSPIHGVAFVAESQQQNEAKAMLTQLRELLAEKEHNIQVMREESIELQDKLTTMESQMVNLEQDNEEKLRKITELSEALIDKTEMNKNMVLVVEEYEKTIAVLIADTEEDKKTHAKEKEALIKERDEQTAHLSSMEVSFSDLHSKYEKSKQVILTFKANEDKLKKSIKDCEDSFKKMQTNYDLLKQHATTKLNMANQEFEKVNKAHQAELLKMSAMIKRKELDITSLEETLSQKIKANEELTSICDELINKVG